MGEPVVVTFVRFHPPYNAGDKAGFDPKTAEDLVQRKLAILSVPVLERVSVVKDSEPANENQTKEEQATPVPPVQPSRSAAHGRKSGRR